MEDFEKGAKRKCTQCSTLFFDFGKFPITCPNCGYELTSLLTNVSKRGRPPKILNLKKRLKKKKLKLMKLNKMRILLILLMMMMTL